MKKGRIPKDAAFFISSPRKDHSASIDRLGSRAGTKTRVATSVQPSDSSRSRPMLAVPGWCDAASDPKAVPVVSAENSTARAVGLDSGSLIPARQFMTK